MRVLLLLAVALTGALAQDCPSNIPWEAIGNGAEQDENELYDEELRPVYELQIFDMEGQYIPYEGYTVGIVANDKKIPFNDFTVTVENNDELCSTGSLKSTTRRSREDSACPHVLVANDEKPKTKISFRWKAAECGCVTIRATILDLDENIYYMDDISDMDGYLTKTVCPEGLVMPDAMDLSEDEIEALETADAISGLSDDEIALLEEIVETIVDEDDMPITDITVDISHGDMNMVIYNEVCSEQRQQTSLSNPIPHSLSIYSCCRVSGEDRRDCFLTKEHPEYVIEKLEEARLSMMCERMTMEDDVELKNRNREMYFCCAKSDKAERSDCFKEAKSERYDRYCRGENEDIFFSMDTTPQRDTDGERHFCCDEEGDDMVTCLNNEERRVFFPRLGEDVDEESYNDMEGRRLARICRRFESEDGEYRSDRRGPRIAILSRCCQKPEGQRRECIQRAKHNRIDRVCMGDNIDEDTDEDTDVNELIPRYDRADVCCKITGEFRYGCFRRKVIRKVKSRRPMFMPQGPRGNMMLGHIEDSRIERLCTNMMDGSMEDYAVKDDILACCQLSRLERNKCFKVSERQHLDNVCNAEETDYVYRLGHYGEVVDEEDMDDIVTMDNPCCEETDEERYECFDSMSKLHLWAHRPMRCALKKACTWRLNPEDRFNEEHRERICERVMSGSSEEADQEFGDASWGWGMMAKEEIVTKMRQCCMMEGDESRQCMLEARKIKIDMACEQISEREDVGMWTFKKKQCCEKTGDERYQCFDDMREMMGPGEMPRRYWNDPENRFNEEHRDRICTRVGQDDAPEEIEKEVDEETEMEYEKLSLGKIMSGFKGMLRFFYSKVAKEEDFMNKIRDCCLVIEDDTARSCFEEARRIRVDNMCEMILEDGEEDEDDKDTGLGFFGRTSFWLPGKRRCCAMEGDERYQCLEEMKRSGMHGMMHGRRPGMGMGDTMMPAVGRGIGQGMGHGMGRGIGHGMGHGPRRGMGFGMKTEYGMDSSDSESDSNSHSDSDSSEERTTYPGRRGGRKGYGHGKGRDSRPGTGMDRPGMGGPRPGRPDMGRRPGMGRQENDRRPGPMEGRLCPFRGVMIPTREDKIVAMCERLTDEDSSADTFTLCGRDAKDEDLKEGLRACCMQETMEDKRSCIEHTRRKNIDDFCGVIPITRVQRPDAGFPLTDCCKNNGDERYDCFKDELEKRQTGKLDNTKIDNFCETPVARTVLLRGMPSRPGLPPAWCCDNQGTERYECFSNDYPNMYIAPMFDLTADKEEEQYFPRFYVESSEEWRRDGSPSFEQDKVDGYVDNSEEVYQVATANSDEDIEDDEDEDEDSDNEEIGRCCRIGRGVGSKIDDAKFIKCNAKSFQFALKEGGVGASCRRAFVRCCIGRREKEGRGRN